MKTSIYCRVSTDKQEADNQLIQLREYCNKQEYKVYKEYVDIISGKENSRPAYDQMFLEAHKRLFDLVLFWDLSRFSRAGTLFTLQKLKELENLGIDWESYQEPYFKSVGQFKDVVLSIIATVAKIEREKISERTKAGLERARKKGKPIGKRGKDKKPRSKAGYFGRRC
jgi:DNA invertase Pin-like site-specific DNA recombinase|tara:strand:+ start:107 stop:613 length:507 start_codon:yes stop_codon:yes gene_type:complete